MKTAGLIGGLGPESTVEYYKQIIAEYRAVSPGGHYPRIIINSIDLNRMLEWLAARDYTSIADTLSLEVEKLAHAGADFGALCANTPHIVFNEVVSRSPIPLISIVEETCNAAQALGLNRIGLFGTRFTMQASFYPKVFSLRNMQLVTPRTEEQTFLHEKYLGELVHGIFLPQTRDGLLAIAKRMKEQESIQGLILGGTELPLILSAPSYHGIPFLDTTRIHVDSIVKTLLA